MGLKGSIENEYGVEFNYHRISDVRILIKDNTKQLRITVDSYATKEAREKGMKAVRTVNIITNADFAMTAFYTLLKAKFADFGSAEDDFDDDWKAVAGSNEQMLIQQTTAGKLISSKTTKKSEE